MLTIAFIVIQVLSLGVMLLFVHEYRRITFKHEQLLHAIEPGKKPSSTFQSGLITFAYTVATIIMMFGTSALLYLVLNP